MARNPRQHEPKYVISVAARIVELHPQTLRHYEELGLVRPNRSGGNRRLYSELDIERLNLICRLVNELGVNLAGVEVILNMTEQIQALNDQTEQQVQELNAEIDRLRRLLAGESRSRLVPFMPPLPPTVGGAAGAGQAE